MTIVFEMCNYWFMNYLELEDRLYTSTEVAKVLGVSLRSVYRYLEDGKLDAEMKTATGRHRFTKQNILDFLSPQAKKVGTSTGITSAPSGAVSSAPRAAEVTRPVATPVSAPVHAQVAEEKVAPVSPVSSRSTVVVEEELEVEEVVVEQAPVKEEEKEEEVDWLSKFRAAAEKYKAETQETEKVAEPVREAPRAAATVSGLTDFTTAPAYKEEAPAKVVSKEHYYVSSVGGLKEIAQNIDKSAKKASLDYAFTLNAGLSLHKPIAPFSVIHAYVRSEDLPFFEKILDLTSVSKSEAQLCLIVDDSDTLYGDANEMHGLTVVSDARLRKDLLSAGEDSLAKELDA